MSTPHKKSAPGANRADLKNALHTINATPPSVTGQCGQVLALIRSLQPVISFVLTADHAIPDAAARVHDLSAAVWNILTTIHQKIIFLGIERRNVACSSIGTPVWPRPGFLDTGKVHVQFDLDLNSGVS